jgi:hypothetical protein
MSLPRKVARALTLIKNIVTYKTKKMIDRIIGGSTKKKTTCWKGCSNIVHGKPQFKKKGGKMVPDCKPTKKKK